jgi:hypothetical protein
MSIKSVGAALDFSLPQKLLDEQMHRFRELLREATMTDKGEPRFSTYPKEADSDSPEFHKHIGRFARYGRELYRALLLRHRLRPSLQKVAWSEGQKIQIVRFDPNFVLPWAAVYDFKLPTPITGSPDPKMCLGWIKDTAGKLFPCGHTADHTVYCINGFWGVRHIVEELIDSGAGLDGPDHITRMRRAGAVRLAVDVPEPHIDEMQRTFEREMRDGFAPITDKDEFLDLLWEDAERPALLVVVGHFETEPIRGEPDGPRMKLPKGWLVPGEIVDRMQQQTWQQPYTLVLLMGCQTGLLELGTLAGFATAFNGAHAAGVAGTEIVAFSRLLTRFAQEITLALWRDGNLGAAITKFRRNLLAAGNPLAFVFQALGCADVHLKLGE